MELLVLKKWTSRGSDQRNPGAWCNAQISLFGRSKTLPELKVVSLRSSWLSKHSSLLSFLPHSQAHKLRFQHQHQSSSALMLEVCWYTASFYSLLQDISFFCCHHSFTPTEMYVHTHMMMPTFWPKSGSSSFPHILYFLCWCEEGALVRVFNETAGLIKARLAVSK